LRRRLSCTTGEWGFVCAPQSVPRRPLQSIQLVVVVRACRLPASSLRGDCGGHRRHRQQIAPWRMFSMHPGQLRNVQARDGTRQRCIILSIVTVAPACNPTCCQWSRLVATRQQFYGKDEMPSGENEKPKMLPPECKDAAERRQKCRWHRRKTLLNQFSISVAILCRGEGFEFHSMRKQG
jgi:hypothetical protein